MVWRAAGGEIFREKVLCCWSGRKESEREFLLREKEGVSIKEREVSNLGIKPEGGLQKVVFREKEEITEDEEGLQVRLG